MREAFILFPRNDNKGQPLEAEHINLQNALLDLFGGYTASDVAGGWTDKAGKVYRDASIKYSVAADWSEILDARLVDLARQYGYWAQQDSIYLQHSNGEVEVIDSTTDRAPRLDDILRNILHVT